MKITVKGSTMVKPMEETPSGSVWLSSLDLVYPEAFHAPSVKFYRSNGAANFFDTEMLKAALSRALVVFYPYAGRLRKDDNGRIEINCTAEGAMFVEAESDGTLDDLGGFATRAYVSLTPTVDYSNGISSFPLFLVQLTRFKCGGVSLGLVTEHHVCDGISTLHFYNTWSEIARGLTPTVLPSFDRRLLSPRNPPRPQFPHIEHRPPPRLKTARQGSKKSISTFKLTREQIQTLKKSCKSDYTSFEVVAGHVWRCATVARRLPADQETMLQLPVDVRQKLLPPLPPGFFGNGIFQTGAFASCGELVSEPLGSAAARVHAAISRMDDEYLRSALDYAELKLSEVVRIAGYANSPNLGITSWARLPAYETDFGWGKPVYSGPGPGAVMFEGQCVLIGDPQNEGSMLLVIKLHKCHMQEFEKLLFGDGDHQSPLVMSKI